MISGREIEARIAKIETKELGTSLHVGFDEEVANVTFKLRRVQVEIFRPSAKTITSTPKGIGSPAVRRAGGPTSRVTSALKDSSPHGPDESMVTWPAIL